MYYLSDRWGPTENEHLGICLGDENSIRQMKRRNRPVLLSVVPGPPSVDRRKESSFKMFKGMCTIPVDDN